MEKYEYGQSGCYGCIIRCRKRYRLAEGKYQHDGEGPDYGHIGAFGFTIGNNNLETVLRALYICNKYGLDTMEVGSIVAWITELYEKGIIDSSKLGGLRPRWGDEDFLLEIIESIVFRRGIGDILAEGIKIASKYFGEETLYYAIQTKGQSWILSDDRPVPSFSLGMSVSTRGADHLRSRPALDLYGLPEDLLEELYGGKVSNDFRSYEGKSRMIHWHELEYAVVDSLGLCKFQTRFISVKAPTFEEWTKLIKYATGLEFSVRDLYIVGERVYTLERMFNVREGFRREDDYPPDRMFREGTQAEGVTVEKGTKLDKNKYDRLLTEYYELHGWDKDGVPRDETLKKLGLSWKSEKII
jgi:aldehyde:ferredoxin oxidoreductase